MHFKKNLLSGQSSLEYFILLSLLVFITLISFSSREGGFFKKTVDALQGKDGFFQKVVAKMAK